MVGEDTTKRPRLRLEVNTLTGIALPHLMYPHMRESRRNSDPLVDTTSTKTTTAAHEHVAHKKQAPHESKLRLLIRRGSANNTLLPGCSAVGMLVGGADVVPVVKPVERQRKNSWKDVFHSMTIPTMLRARSGSHGSTTTHDGSPSNSQVLVSYDPNDLYGQVCIYFLMTFLLAGL